jgi:hypothetical protein
MLHAVAQAVLLQHRTSALDQADQNCDYRQYEQDVYETPERIRANHAQKPKNQEQNSDCPEHVILLSGKSRVSFSSN